MRGREGEREKEEGEEGGREGRRGRGEIEGLEVGDRQREGGQQRVRR